MVLEAARQNEGLGDEYRRTPSPCVTCTLNKSTQVVYPKMTKDRAAERLELMHTNIVGTIEAESITRFQYGYTFSCQVANFRAVCFSRAKGQSLGKLMEFTRNHATPHGMKMQRLRSDNGDKCTSNYYRSPRKYLEILQEVTVPCMRQQNETSERDGRTLMNIARCFFNEFRLPTFLWSEMVAIATYPSSRIPHRTI